MDKVREWVPPSPRGERRIVFNSDPSTVATQILPDIVTEKHLSQMVDIFGDAGIDTLIQDCWNQGFTVYWRSDRLQYDQRPQHGRFLHMLDRGVQPLQVMRDRCRERGMSFLAGFRMNDTHDFPVYADFMQNNPEFILEDRRKTLDIKLPPEASLDKGGKPLDYSHEPVRAFVYEAINCLLTEVEVDGVELIFRDPGYFPVPQAADHHLHLMTDLIQTIRSRLDELGQERDQRLLLGVRVWSTLSECRDIGLDVPKWIADGLIDYCAPMDSMFSDFNAEYEKFSELASGVECRVYPGLHPWTSNRMRRRAVPMTNSMCRALAHTFYAGGADGVSVFNDFVGNMWSPPFYPQSLHRFHELRDPERVCSGERHYVFDPPWAGVPWGGYGRNGVGVLKVPRTVLDRGKRDRSGIFRFVMYERMDRVSLATLLLTGEGLTEHDELEVLLNGTLLPEGPLGNADWRTRERFTMPVIATNDPPGLVTRSGPPRGKGTGNEDRQPRSLMDRRWFVLPKEAPLFGENTLTITLIDDGSKSTGEVVIDEVEIWVQPKVA